MILGTGRHDSLAGGFAVFGHMRAIELPETRGYIVALIKSRNRTSAVFAIR